MCIRDRKNVGPALRPTEAMNSSRPSVWMEGEMETPKCPNSSPARKMPEEPRLIPLMLSLIHI